MEILPKRTGPLFALALLFGLARPEGIPAASPQIVPEECHARFQQGSWKVYESANFRFFHLSPESQILALVSACETTRTTLRAAWLRDPAAESWSPKCDVLLYDQPEAFTNGSGFPPETGGVANLEVGQGRVWCRRIHARFDRPEKTSDILLHELVHVVLADRFSTRRIPRWLDEGIAFLNESGARHGEYSQLVESAKESSSLFPVRALLSSNAMTRTAEEVKLFYGQSASLVAFLTMKGSEALLMDFVEAAQAGEPDAALKEHYGIENVAELEKEWKRFLTRRIAEQQVFAVDP